MMKRTAGVSAAEAEEPWRSGDMGNLRLSPILKSSDTAAPRGVAVLS
jgi:hypothetical protein